MLIQGEETCMICGKSVAVLVPIQKTVRRTPIMTVNPLVKTLTFTGPKPVDPQIHFTIDPRRGREDY